MKFKISMVGSKAQNEIFTGEGRTLPEALNALVERLVHEEHEVGSDDEAYADLEGLKKQLGQK